MKQYLLRYLVMYAALAGVFAVVSALVRFPSTIGVLIPGLLAALVGMGYVRDHLQAPTNRDRLEFAGWGALITAAVSVVLLGVAIALAKQGAVEPVADMANIGGGPFALFAVVLFALNFATIYIGVGIGARGGLNRIAHPEAFPSSKGQSFDSNRGVSKRD